MVSTCSCRSAGTGRTAWRPRRSPSAISPISATSRPRTSVRRSTRICSTTPIASTTTSRNTSARCRVRRTRRSPSRSICAENGSPRPTRSRRARRRNTRSSAGSSGATRGAPASTCITRWRRITARSARSAPASIPGSPSCGRRRTPWCAPRSARVFGRRCSPNSLSTRRCRQSARSNTILARAPLRQRAAGDDQHAQSLSHAHR